MAEATYTSKFFTV